jgi:hypothetical protein
MFFSHRYFLVSVNWIDCEQKGYKIRIITQTMSKRTMPVCLTAEQYKKIEKIAKKHGLLNASQAIEKVLMD